LSTCFVIVHDLQAFSKDEISKGKALQSKLEDFLQVLNYTQYILWYHLQETEQVWKDMHWLDSAVQIGRKTDIIHGVPLRSLRKNPITSQPQSRSSSMSFTTSTEKKKELPDDQDSAHFEKHLSTFPEELKVTPLYNTGLTKGSTVKVTNRIYSFHFHCFLCVVTYRPINYGQRGNPVGCWSFG